MSRVHRARLLLERHGLWIAVIGIVSLPLITGFNCSFFGPSGSEPEWDEVDQRCDFINALQPDPECGGGGPGGGPSDSRCRPASTGYHFCGYCARTPGEECRYCPDQAYCASDPCSEHCGPRTTTYRCPATHPVSCSDGSCCGSAHPVCCEGSCWTSRAACEAYHAPPPSSGVTDACRAAGYLQPAISRAGCCSPFPASASPRSCDWAACVTGDLQHTWYQARDGWVSATCSTSDRACIDASARATVTRCR